MKFGGRVSVLRPRALIAIVLGLSALGLSAAGCANPATKEGQAPPLLSDPSKADEIGVTVAPLGRLGFGENVTGDFVEDEQYDGYYFAAAAGTEITLDNSNLGTARRLDSMLHLYGPMNAEGFYGADPIATDDDSGWGTHARIRDFTIPESGRYLAVLTTYAGLDRGHYRLELRCEGESCAIACDESCDTADECSLNACDAQYGCIQRDMPAGCVNPNIPQVVVSATTVNTDENGGGETFTVYLTTEPTEHVTVNIGTSNPDEGAVYPQNLLFCAAGFEETAFGCSPLEEGVTLDTPHWQRTVEVSVSGVQDGIDDGAQAFSLNFTTTSYDPDYNARALDSIECMNADAAQVLDYSSTDGLADEDLLRALQLLSGDHVGYGYHGSNSARTLLFSSIDVHDGQLESLYSGELSAAAANSSLAFQQGFNTEHTWPQSQFSRVEPAVSDLHHIYPCDVGSNSLRSSYHFGWNGSHTSSRSMLGTSSGGSSRVYQVRPERRGDVARAHFYMVARYLFDEGDDLDFDDNSNDSDGAIIDWEEATLREWHDEDPVDDIERIRNNRIESYQGNRNPFVDRPDLVARIANF